MQHQGHSTQSTCGVLETLTHNLAELGSTSTTLPTYQPSCSTGEDEHLMHVNSHM